MASLESKNSLLSEEASLTDVDLTRIRIKASIKELKDKGFIEVATRYFQYFVTQKAPMSRVCHAPGIEGCAEHLVVLSASIELYGLVTGFLLLPPSPPGNNGPVHPADISPDCLTHCRLSAACS